MSEDQNNTTTDERPTTAKAWKKKQGIELNVPSGNVCLARRPGMQTFIKEGIIPNSLMPIVKKAMSGKMENVDLQKEAMKATEGDEEKAYNTVIEFIDNITLFCVIEPKLEPIPVWQNTKSDATYFTLSESEVGKEVPLNQRNDELLFIDEVDMDDKFFIYQWAVGGSADVERFREQHRAAMESLSPSENVVNAAESTS